MRTLRLAAAIAVSLSASVGHAITSDEVNAGIQFNFANPGARALAMGGAFLGLADDATAAYTNPAGLTVLGASELAFEFRSNDFDTPFSSGGSFGVTPFDPSGLGRSEADSNTKSASFLSYTHAGDGWAVAVYRHQPLDFATEYTQQQIDIRGTTSFLPLKSTRLQAELLNYGVSGAYQFSNNFSLGLGLVHSKFRLSSDTVRSGRNFQLQRGDDSDTVFTAGALWRIDSQWAVGAAYRRGGDFRYRAGNFNAAGEPLVVVDTGFKVPHMYGIGLSWRPSENLALALDINRVKYSRLTDSFDDIFSSATVLRVDDGTELRLGAEYVFSQFANPFVLRGGIWRDPDHALTAVGPSAVDVDIDRALFRPGENETHYTIGFGWAFPQFQFDVAADFSENIRTYSASGVVRF